MSNSKDNKAPETPDMPNIEQASISQGLYPKSARHQSSEANEKGGDSGLWNCGARIAIDGRECQGDIPGYIEGAF